ncbi:MAG: protein translocase subunit SecF [Nitrospirae bacterium]|nr:protein translocase subunit SecF [Candidatus Troglogloeales bacterium]
MVELFQKTDIDFVGKRFIFFIISGLAVLLGIVTLIQMSRGPGGGVNMGVDFAGGTAIALKFQKPIGIEEARKILSRGGLSDAELQAVVSEQKLLVRIKKAGGGKTDARVSELFSKSLPENSFVVESSTEIGPKIGQKLQKDALLAISLSMLGIILYIAFRFEFRFGVAAVIATFHDVLVILGIFYLLDKEITLLFLTALLTIAGYSLSDTVVVFDRIRENLRTKKRELLPIVINRSINEVLARTFNTSFTTLLAVGTLFLFGGEVIHDFALAMVLGVIVGTYSSWFIASPLLMLLKHEAPVFKKT